MNNIKLTIFIITWCLMLLVFCSANSRQGSITGNITIDAGNDNSNEIIITSQGNIGLGVTNPGNTLDVSGNVDVSGNITTQNLNITGQLTYDYSNISANTSLGDTSFIMVDTSSQADIQINLPLASEYDGQIYTIKNTSHGNVYINGGGNLIDGDTNIAISDSGTAKFISDGNQWYLIETSSSSSSASDNLVGWWKLDETSGNTTIDSSSQGNSGTLLGIGDNIFQFTGSNGKINQSLQFDGLDDHINFGDIDALDFGTGDFSICFWLYRNHNDAANLRVLSKGANDDSAGMAGFSFFGSNEVLQFAVNPSGTRTYNSGNITTNEWIHVAATVKRGGSQRLFINAIEHSSASAPGGSVSSGHPFKIGTKFDLGLYWDGSIDDVRFYNKALSQNEVKAIIGEPDIHSGLIGHWPLDFADASGNAIDISSNNNHGTLNGFTFSDNAVAGISGNALSFDGVNDYIEITNESPFDISGNITVACWIKVKGFTSPWQAIVTKGDTSWRISRFQSQNILHFGSTGLSSAQSNGVSDVNDGQWHHATFVFNGTTKVIYLDGNLETRSASTGSISLNNFKVQIGNNAETVGRNFQGQIDDVRIYNRALSDREVKHLYNSYEVNDIDTGLVGHWKFDETNGSIAYDSSPSEINGTITNMGAGNIGMEGISGNAFNFDGVDDRIEFGNPSALNNFTNKITLTAWVKTTGANNINILAKPNAEAPTSPFAEYLLGIISEKPHLRLNSDYVTGLKTITDNKWHFVAGVYDGSQMMVYTDGVLDGTPVAKSGNILSSSVGFRISKVYNTNLQTFSGLIDEVRVYNRALSASEIYSLYRQDGLWSPNDITTSFWYDASDSSTLTMSGNLVEQWNDKSGNENHLIQATSTYKPYYLPTKFNSLPAIDFYLHKGLRHSSNVTVESIITVIKSDHTNWGHYHSISDPRTSRGGGVVQSGNKGFHNNRYPTDLWKNGTIITPIDPDCLDPINNIFIVAFDKASAQSSTFDGLSVGNYDNSNMGGSAVQSEIIGVPTAFTTEQRQKLEGYLAHKWGIEANLPADHPYKNAPP